MDEIFVWLAQNFLFSGKRGISPGVKRWWVKLTTHLKPKQTLRSWECVELHPYFPIFLRGVVLNLAQDQVGCYLPFPENLGTKLKWWPRLCTTCHHTSAQYLTPYHMSLYSCTIPDTVSLVTIYLDSTWHPVTCHYISAQYLKPFHLSPYICTVPDNLSLVTIYLHSTWHPITCHYISAQYLIPYHLSPYICTAPDTLLLVTI